MKKTLLTSLKKIFLCICAVAFLCSCQDGSDSDDSELDRNVIDILRSGIDPVSTPVLSEYGNGKSASGFGDLKSVNSIVSPGTTYIIGNSSDPKDANGYFAAQVLSDAVKNLNAGDTLILKDGNYAGCINLKELNGNAGNYITIKAEHNRMAVLHGITADSGKAIIKLNKCSYVKIDGLELKDAVAKKSSKGVHITPPSHHIAIVNCHFTNIKTTIPTNKGSAHGICIWGDDASNTIHDVLIKGNEFDNMATGWSECITVTANSENINIIGNKLTETGNIGIDAGGNYGYCSDPLKDFARFVYISDNDFYGCNSPNAMSDAIYLDGGQHIIIEGNRIHYGQSGISINSEQVVSRKECWPGDVVIRNNVIENTTRRAFGCGVGNTARNASVMHVLFQGNSCNDNGTQSSSETALVFTICKDVKILNNTFISSSYKQNGIYYKFHDTPEASVLHQDIVISGNTWTNIKNPETN